MLIINNARASSFDQIFRKFGAYDHNLTNIIWIAAHSTFKYKGTCYNGTATTLIWLPVYYLSKTVFIKAPAPNNDPVSSGNY